MLQAEKVLKSLVEQGWLERSRKDYYSLSPRALMELRGWLIETYNEDDSDDEGEQTRPPRIKMCHACKEIITTVGSTHRSGFANLTLQGPKVSKTIVSMSVARHLHTELLPESKVEEMSPL